MKLAIAFLLMTWALTGCSVTIVQPPAVVIVPAQTKPTTAHCVADAKLPEPPAAIKAPVVSESDPTTLADALALYALQLKKQQREYNTRVAEAFKHYVDTC